MKKLHFTSLSRLGLLLLLPLALPAADTGLRGPATGNLPTITRPAPGAPVLSPLSSMQRIPRMLPFSQADYGALKANRPALRPADAHVFVDQTASPSQAEQISAIPGPGYNGSSPSDAAIAAGPSHVIAMVNKQFTIYEKSTMTAVAGSTFFDWWGAGTNIPTDPRCYFDSAAGGHYVMTAFSVISTGYGTGASSLFVSVSQTSDPTGAWWNYVFDNTADGGTPTNTWGDQPGLGYDSNAVYISTNQYSFSGYNIEDSRFDHVRIRVLSKAQLYTGAPATYTDFINPPGASYDGFEYRLNSYMPARSLSPTNTEYIICTSFKLSKPYGYVQLLKIENAPAAPVLTKVADIEVRGFYYPPGAEQPDSTQEVDTGDGRAQDAVWRDGYLYEAFTDAGYLIHPNRITPNAIGDKATIRFLKINTNTARLDSESDDITYAGPAGTSVFFPAVSVDASGNVGMVFCRSSASEYPSLYAAKRPASTGKFGDSLLVAAGTTANPYDRWGDYSAVHNDDELGGLWVFGQDMRVSPWATDIGFLPLQ